MILIPVLLLSSVSVGRCHCSARLLTIALHDILQRVPSLQVLPITSSDPVTIHGFGNVAEFVINRSVREYSMLLPLGLSLIKEQPYFSDHAAFRHIACVEDGSVMGLEGNALQCARLLGGVGVKPGVPYDFRLTHGVVVAIAVRREEAVFEDDMLWLKVSCAIVINRTS